MSEAIHPTPYTNVNVVLRELLTSTQAILGSHFLGMYLSGSLALGDFDARSSDVDLVVVTDAELPDDLVEALRAMHAQFDASGSPWAAKVDAVYIPQEALRSSAASSGSYPQVEWGRGFFVEHLEDGWCMQCAILREHGVVLAGPDPRTLIEPVDPQNLRRASAVIAETWQEQAHHDPSWLVWLQHGGEHAFVVLTLCRILYTLDQGTVASKPAAARWAHQAAGARWASLIERALAGRHERQEVSARDVQETIALINYAVERSRQQEAEAPPGESR